MKTEKVVYSIVGVAIGLLTHSHPTFADDLKNSCKIYQNKSGGYYGIPDGAFMFSVVPEYNGKNELSNLTAMDPDGKILEDLYAGPRIIKDFGKVTIARAKEFITHEGDLYAFIPPGTIRDGTINDPPIELSYKGSVCDKLMKTEVTTFAFLEFTITVAENLTRNKNGELN